MSTATISPEVIIAAIPGTKSKGTGVKDVPAAAFIAAYSDHLKKTGKIELPKWVDVIKLGRYKELAPINPDWYYVRAATIARRVYLEKGIGVSSLAKSFGGKHRRGVRRSHWKPGARGVIKHCLKQLEGLGVLLKEPKTGGRKITPTGQRDLDRIAGQVKSKLWAERKAIAAAAPIIEHEEPHEHEEHHAEEHAEHEEPEQEEKSDEE